MRDEESCSAVLLLLVECKGESKLQVELVDIGATVIGSNVRSVDCRENYHSRDGTLLVADTVLRRIWLRVFEVSGILLKKHYC